MSTLPRLTEVFLFEKNTTAPAPTKAAASKKTKKATPIRGKHFTQGKGMSPGHWAGPSKGDPIKDTGFAEHFATDHGDYCIFKGLNNGQYYGHYVSADGKKVEDLDAAPNRQEMVDRVLAHHDEKVTGL